VPSDEERRTDAMGDQRVVLAAPSGGCQWLGSKVPAIQQLTKRR
jgi:hypothetical protein